MSLNRSHLANVLFLELSARHYGRISTFPLFRARIKCYPMVCFKAWRIRPADDLPSEERSRRSVGERRPGITDAPGGSRESVHYKRLEEDTGACKFKLMHCRVTES